MVIELEKLMVRNTCTLCIVSIMYVETWSNNMHNIYYIHILCSMLNFWISNQYAFLLHLVVTVQVLHKLQAHTYKYILCKFVCLTHTHTVSNFMLPKVVKLVATIVLMFFSCFNFKKCTPATNANHMNACVHHWFHLYNVNKWMNSHADRQNVWDTFQWSFKMGEKIYVQ